MNSAPLPEIPEEVYLESALQLFLASTNANREKDWDTIGPETQASYISLAKAGAVAVQKEAVEKERKVVGKLEDKINWFQSTLQGVQMDLEDSSKENAKLKEKLRDQAEILENLSSDLSLAGEKSDWRREVERIQDEMLKAASQIVLYVEANNERE